MKFLRDNNAVVNDSYAGVPAIRNLPPKYK